MPSEKQLTLIHTVPVTAEGVGSSHTARLRASFSSHEKSVVATNPIAQYQTGFFEIPADVTLFADDEEGNSLKSFYGRTVLRGRKNIPGSGFPGSGPGGLGGGVDLSYGDAPGIGKDAGGPTPEGESAPGEDGSSIHSSGLGPNVNIHGTLGEGGTRRPVDAKPAGPTPFEGSGEKSPQDSTVYSATGMIPAGGMGKSEETVSG